MHGCDTVRTPLVISMRYIRVSHQTKLVMHSVDPRIHFSITCWIQIRLGGMPIHTYIHHVGGGGEKPRGGWKFIMCLLALRHANHY